MGAKRPKLLIAGGSHSDIPMIKAAKALGFLVYTSGNRPGELGHRFGDHYVPLDYSDKTAVLDAARTLNVDAICPACNDFSAISAAYAAEKLGLPGYDDTNTTTRLHHKDSFRVLARECGLRTPAASSFDCAERALRDSAGIGLPVIVKPVDLTGGKGVSKVETREKLPAAIETAFSASRNNRIIVEEFVTGTYHAMSAFVKDRRVVFYLTDNELYYLNPFLVSGAYAPGSVPAAAEARVCRDIERIAEALGLADGLVHAQFILAGDTPVVIEICRRPPGDLYVDLVSHVAGIDYAKWIVMSYAGLNPKIEAAPQRKVPMLRHCVMGDRAGHVTGIHVAPSIANRVVDRLEWAEGVTIDQPLSQKVGIFFLQFDDPATLRAHSEIMPQLIYPLYAS